MYKGNHRTYLQCIQLNFIETTSITCKKQASIMFSHSLLLRTFVFLFAATTIASSNAIPSPNAHVAAIQVDEHEHQPVVLENRTPREDYLRLMFSVREYDLIFELCQTIEKEYKENDYWFFVGNSGG
jgi:hypothetical protein